MIQSFAVAISGMSIVNLLLIIGGVLLGLIFGAIPGLSTTMAVALFLPITFAMKMFPSMSLLIGLYIGGFSGGLISAILLNIPGTAASMMTTMDGYPMAKKGQAAKALGLGITSSFLGGGLSIIALILIAPALAKVALKFGSFEYFSLTFFALSMIVTMSSKDVTKGVISGLLGILTAMIGPAPIDSYPRFTFGFRSLETGINSTVVLIGIFAISEIFILGDQKNQMKITKENVQVAKIHGFGFSFAEYWVEKWNLLVSAVIGILIGILPGIGGALASIMSYNASKKLSKHPEEFGTGCNAGIVASETANNAAIGGAMIPLLALGIPGDAVTALLLSAFTMKGVQPGPLMFTNNADTIYFIFVAMLIANVIMLIANYFSIGVFVKLLKIPKHLLFPIVGFLCILGVYGLNRSSSDLTLMLVFGIIGFFMKKWDLKAQPFIIGMLVGFMAEQNLRRAMMFSDGSFLPFVTSPLSLLFLIAGFASIIITIYRSVKQKNSISAE